MSIGIPLNALPCTVHDVVLVANYPNANTFTGGALNTDGVWWGDGGLNVVRTILALLSNAVGGITPTPAMTSGLNGTNAPVLNHTFTTNIMVPVPGGAQFSPSLATSHYVGRLVKGSINIRCNAAGPSSIVTGDIGGAVVCDTRGNPDWERSLLASRAMWPKDALGSEKAQTGLHFDWPPFFTSLQGLRSRDSTGEEFSLGSDVSVTDTNNMFYVSHCGTSSVATNVSVASIPWGSTPSIMVQIGASTNATHTTVALQVCHVFARMTSTGVCSTLTRRESFTVTISTRHTPRVVCNPRPLSVGGVPISLRDGIWIGSFFGLEHGANIAFTFSTMLSTDDERRFGDVVLTRIDNASAPISCTATCAVAVRDTATYSSYTTNAAVSLKRNREDLVSVEDALHQQGHPLVQLIA